jgi:murein DD-endopeptidase MepM/ murein hydrolase activator NlpD
MKNKLYIIVTGIFLMILVLAACDNPTGSENRTSNKDVVSAHVTDLAGSHPQFTLSDGIYRIPYSDGTNVFVTRDHHTHAPARDRIDMSAGEGAEIAAAASGWIRGIVDHNGQSPNPGDGLSADSTAAQDDSLEHTCSNNNPDPEADPPEPPNPIIGSCGDYNNYVWIEHPNGEWTKYTHFGTGTVQLPPPAGFGWSVGDWVEAGQTLGLESDIGAASTASGEGQAFHLHFEVARPNNPDAGLQWSLRGGFIQNAFNVVPLICDIPDHSIDGVSVLETNESYTADACQHDPPVADAGGPYEVDEGSQLLLDGTGSFDPDGLPLTYSWEPAGNINDSTLAQPVFTAGTSMVVDLTLTVYDQTEALRDSDNTTVTVKNVVPAVTIDPGQVTEINEGGTVTVTAEFSDPGWLDTHTAAISWGVPAGHEGIELAPAAIQILNSGGPDDPLVGRVTGTYQYGDMDDGNGFTIEVTVTDSDGGTGSDSFQLTVNNVDPTSAINPEGTVLINGVPTVIASAGENIDLDGYAADPGSDDLTLTWDWGDGSTVTRVSLVNPPSDDPLPSPSVQPRHEPDQASHTYSEACLFEVTFSAADDDGGAGSATMDVVITGNAEQARSSGYWNSEYRMVKNPDFTPAALQCYLDIVNHVSVVFSDHRNLHSADDAVDVLWTRGRSTEDDLFDRQLLAAWLNFSNGAYRLNQMVDTTGNGVPDTFYHDVMLQAETLRTDPARIRSEVLAMKDLLERLNPDS